MTESITVIKRYTKFSFPRFFWFFTHPTYTHRPGDLKTYISGENVISKINCDRNTTNLNNLVLI